MRSRSITAPQGMIYQSAGPIVPVGFGQMTVALFGLAIYLFCVHSFKLPIASVGIGIGVIGVLMHPKGLSVPTPFVFMCAFLVWCTFASTQSQFTGVVGPALIDYLKILLIFFVALNACQSMAQLAVFIGLWVLMFGLYPARGTYFNFFGGIGTFGRYGWNFSFANYNDLAAYAILALSLSAFLLAGRFPKWVRTAAMASTAGLALLVVITQSRGAFIGLVVAFALMLFRSRSRTRLIRFGLIAAVGIVLAAPGAVWERFSRMKFLTSTDTIGEADSSAEQRWVLLQIAAEIAKQNAITGVGLGAYSDAHGVYAEERQEWAMGRGNRDAHNMYLSLLAETGIPGLLLFVGMLGSTLVRASRTEKALRTRLPLEAEQLRILRFGLVAYMISAIFGSFHRVSFLYLFIAVLWTAAVLFEQQLRAVTQAAPASGMSFAPAQRFMRSRSILRHVRRGSFQRQ
jgi:O-antigen ligase